MSYQVAWEQGCFEELDEMLRAGEPAWMLTACIRQIAEQLSVAPFDAGQELSEELRIVDVWPLRVYFFVEPLEGAVKVTFVRLLK